MATFKCDVCDRTAAPGVNAHGQRLCRYHAGPPSEEDMREHTQTLSVANAQRARAEAERVVETVTQRHVREQRERVEQLHSALKQSPDGRYGPQGNATTKDFINRLRNRARSARDVDALRGVVLGLLDLLEDTL